MRELILCQQDDGTWTAECRELPGYRAEGKTREEAIEKMKKAILIYHPCRCED